MTEAAPLDALVQRFGRINRRRTTETIGKLKPVHVLEPAPSCLPYDRAIVEASFAQLPDHGQVLPEQELQTRIDTVYPTLEVSSISTHVIWDGDRCTLRELCNNARSVLVDVLDIESTACILEADRQTYLDAKWETRTMLEIPVSWRSMYAHKTKYERLAVGNMPFVVPGNEDYEELGLQFEDHNPFL